MSDSVAIDALPYYDHGYDEPGVREGAIQLVEEEMQKYRPTKNYLDHLPAPGTQTLFIVMDTFFFEDYDVFLTDLMKNEMKRIKEKKTMELLSTERYNLPAPTPGLRHDPESWIQSGNEDFLCSLTKLVLNSTK